MKIGYSGWFFVRSKLPDSRSPAACFQPTVSTRAVHSLFDGRRNVVVDGVHTLGAMQQFILLDRFLFGVELQALRLDVEKSERIEYSKKKQKYVISLQKFHVNTILLHSQGQRFVPTHTGAANK